MPMFTVHADYPTPVISHLGEYPTIRWDTGLSIQLDANEWAALTEAVSAATRSTEPW